MTSVTRALSFQGRRREVAALAALVCATVFSRLVTRSHYLFNWDSIQYALGVQRFDLVAHRPHPPGYPGYILLGRLFTGLAGGRAEDGLVLLSAVATGAAVLLIFLAARATWGRFAGWTAALLLATSPLPWIYGGVALNYALEPALVVGVIWTCLRACRRQGRWSLVLAAILVALAGAIRPTDELFLLAPLAWAAWSGWRAGDRRDLVLAALSGAVFSLGWLVPLLLASGGAGAYLKASGELSARASDTSAVWKAGLAGLRLNGTAVVAGLVTALGLLVPLGGAYFLVRALLAPGATLRSSRHRDYAVLAMATLLPALVIYILVHIGQLGYLLILLPPLLLPAGVVLEALALTISRRRGALLKHSLLGLCVVANVAIFAVPAGGMRDQVVQNDEYVATLLAMVRRYDPATTLLVTSAEADGSYRLSEYYLSEYPVIAIGRDSRQRAGEMFATGGPADWRGTAPEYDLARFNRAAALALPPSPRTILVLDRRAIDFVGDRSRASVVLFGDELRLWQIEPGPASRAVAAGRYVYFVGADCPCRGASASRPLTAPFQPL